MNKKVVFFVIIALLISSFAFFVDGKFNNNAVGLYRVYLDGDTIGYIDSENELTSYIDRQEEELKKKYNVSNVYAPKNLKILKEQTYNKKASSVKSVYNSIKDKAPFTIKGYKVTIKGIEESDEDKTYITDSVSINVLDKTVFTEALKKTVNVFIKEDDYENYINNTQEKITDTGSIIENVYIQNEIVVTETKISVDDEIFTDDELLSKYLLFGTLDDQKKYTVKFGDTIEQVSYDNKLSVDEFLIANTNFTSADNLLYPGEVVNIGIMKPAFKLIEEDHVVEIQKTKFKTEIVYDDSLLSGVERVKQQGVNGSSKVTKKIKKTNGEIVSAVVMSTEEITPTKNKIIVRGKGTVSFAPIITAGSWAWPTNTPYQITSQYGWRWGKVHEGIDISGTGKGSPIYAVKDGVVVEAANKYPNGNYIVIDHKNGYYSIYAHMSKLLVKKGQIVTIGQQIGKMGATGFATGVHLHFCIWNGYPYRGGKSFNPLIMYR